MSDVSCERMDSESENFEGSGSEAFLEVEVDGEDESEDPTTQIFPYMFEPRQLSLMARPEASPEEQFEERPSEQEGVDQW